jgi:hypothetical protein
MSSPDLRSRLAVCVYAGWTVAVLSAYYVVPDALVSGIAAPIFGGGHAVDAAMSAARSLAGALTVVLAAVALGGMLTAGARGPFERPAERVAYVLAFGFIALSIVSQALAYLDLYTVSIVRAVVITLAVAGAVYAARARLLRTTMPHVRRADVLFLVIAVVAGGFALIGSLAPEVEYDALWYHLWLPQRWLDAGHPVDIIEEYVSLYPLSWDLAYGAALAVDGAGAAKLLHFACLLLVAAATWLLCREIAPRASPACAVAVAVTTPTVLWEATTAYVDLALAWYVALAAYASIRHARTHDQRWFVISALALGGAMAIKHLALVAAAILGGALVIARLRRDTVFNTVRHAMLFTVIAVAVPLPWYARAYAAAGNPVFPDLYAVFGAEPAERWNALTERGLAQFKAKFGRERTASNLAVLPWDVTIHGAQYGGSIGPLFLLLVPAMLLRRPDPALNVVAAGVGAYVAIWASPVSSFQMRFLVPTIPFLAVLAAVGLQHLTQMTGVAGRASPRAIVALVALLLTMNLPPFVEWHDADRHRGGRWLTHVVREVPLAVVVGGESHGEYLRRVVPSYAAWEFVEHHVPPDARVLTFSGGDHLYSNRARLWSDATVAHPLTWGATKRAEAAMLERLHEFGITHVLLDERQLASGAMDDLAIARLRLHTCCFRELYRDRHYSLHALVSAVDLSVTKEPHCGGTGHALQAGEPRCARVGE